MHRITGTEVKFASHEDSPWHSDKYTYLDNHNLKTYTDTSLTNQHRLTLLKQLQANLLSLGVQSRLEEPNQLYIDKQTKEAVEVSCSYSIRALKTSNLGIAHNIKSSLKPKQL